MTNIVQSMITEFHLFGFEVISGLYDILKLQILSSVLVKLWPLDKTLTIRIAEIVK